VILAGVALKTRVKYLAAIMQRIDGYAAHASVRA
jgi:hypothetical protein